MRSNHFAASFGRRLFGRAIAPACLGLVFMPAAAQAAVTAPTDVVGTSAVPTLDNSFGVVKEALNFGGSDLTRDGIAFRGEATGGGSPLTLDTNPFTVSMEALGATSTFLPATVGPDALFETELFAGTLSFPAGQRTLISGLNPGTTYQFQFIHGDTRTGSFNDYDNDVTFTDSTGDIATTHLVFGNAASAGKSFAVIEVQVSGSTSLAYDMIAVAGRGSSVSGLVISAVPSVPTISEWGMATVVLLLLTGLTIKFGMVRFSRKAA